MEAAKFKLLVVLFFLSLLILPSCKEEKECKDQGPDCGCNATSESDCVANECCNWVLKTTVYTQMMPGWGPL